jgi:hypothetical protein
MDPVSGFDRRLGSADLFAVLDDRQIDCKTYEGDLVTRCDRTTGVETAYPRIGAHLHRFLSRLFKPLHSLMISMKSDYPYPSPAPLSRPFHKQEKAAGGASG